MELAQSRSKRKQVSERDAGILKGLAEQDFHHTLCMLPKSAQKSMALRVDPNASEEYIEYFLKHLDQMRKDDPLVLLREGVYDLAKMVASSLPCNWHRILSYCCSSPKRQEPLLLPIAIIAGRSCSVPAIAKRVSSCRVSPRLQTTSQQRCYPCAKTYKSTPICWTVANWQVIGSG